MRSDVLEEYLGHVLDSDPVVRRLTRDILSLQKKLYGEASEAAWRTYMLLEAMVNHRQDEILEKVFERLVRKPRAKVRKSRL